MQRPAEPVSELIADEKRAAKKGRTRGAEAKKGMQGDNVIVGLDTHAEANALYVRFSAFH